METHTMADEVHPQKMTGGKGQKIRNTFLLLLTAMIWGAAFVAQSVSMDYIEPFTFICLRSVIGGVFLLPVIWVMDGMRKRKEASRLEEAMAFRPGGEGTAQSEASPSAGKTAGTQAAEQKPRRQRTTTEVLEEHRLSWKNKKLLKSGIVCGVFLFLANCFQQTGIQYTTTGKAGFLTAFYIIIVPLIGLFFKKRCGILTWIGVAVALVGLYFLSITEKFTIERGDALVLMSAFFYAGQILSIDHYNPMVDGVKMSCIQFLTGGVLGAVLMFLFETPDVSMIVSAAGPILYTGVMSTGVGYTLQIVGQKGLNPTVASLIMSLESVFSALSGYLFLHEILTAREILGCVLVFAAIVLAQLPDVRKRK